jgi:hypothetical protein
MKTLLLGAVAGALAVGAVVLSYDLGQRQALSGQFAMTPAGYQQVANPYLVQAGQTGYISPYAPYATPFAAQTPYGAMVPAGYAAPQAGYATPQYGNERVVATQPVVRRVSSQRVYASERVAKPRRTWQKSALLIGGSAAGGAGVGALIGGKKGAGIGALLGGGSAAIFDQVKRH